MPVACHDADLQLLQADARSAAWLVLEELGCPLRWLGASPKGLQAGEDLALTDFPLLVANRQETLDRFMPWAEALETK